MSFFTRLCIIVVCLSLLFAVSLSASLQYTIYNSTNVCNGPVVATGTDTNPGYSTDGTASAWTNGTCLTVTGTSGQGFQSLKLQCLSGSARDYQGAQLFTDKTCSSPASGFDALDLGSAGHCFNITSTPSGVTVNTGLSMTVNCYGNNGAVAVAALSLPMMALLALVAIVSF